MNTIERIKQLAKEQDITIAAICRKIGVSKGYFTEAAARNRTLPPERLQQIAAILNTTVEYLRGETDQKEKPAVSGELSTLEKEIIELVSKLSEKDIETIIQIIKLFTQKKNDQ